MAASEVGQVGVVAAAAIVADSCNTHLPNCRKQPRPYNPSHFISYATRNSIHYKQHANSTHVCVVALWQDLQEVMRIGSTRGSLHLHVCNVHRQLSECSAAVTRSGIAHTAQGSTHTHTQDNAPLLSLLLGGRKRCCRARCPQTAAAPGSPGQSVDGLRVWSQGQGFDGNP
jgi:hypothetical protein